MAITRMHKNLSDIFTSVKIKPFLIIVHKIPTISELVWSSKKSQTQCPAFRTLHPQ